MCYHSRTLTSKPQANHGAESNLATTEHNLPKLRRSALNPFFSTQTVRNLQPVIEERVDALLDAFQNYAEVSNGQPLDVMYPFSALTNGTHHHLRGWQVRS